MFNGLIFVGGGNITKAMCHLGALETIDRYQDIYHMTYYGGTSGAGSIVATLVASGHALSEIHDILYNIDLNKLKKRDKLGSIQRTYRLFTKYGYYKSDYIEQFIDNILFERFGIRNITFEQMQLRTNKHLRLIGTNLTKGYTIIMDHIYTPNMSVATGVRVSACIPVYFAPVKIDKELFVEYGSMKSYTTFRMFDEYDKRCMVLKLKNTLKLKASDSRCLFVYMCRVMGQLQEEEGVSKDDTGGVLGSVCYINANIVDDKKLKLTRAENDSLRQIGMDAMLARIYERV